MTGLLLNLLNCFGKKFYNVDLKMPLNLVFQLVEIENTFRQRCWSKGILETSSEFQYQWC
jgi:hypothetical protein